MNGKALEMDVIFLLESDDFFIIINESVIRNDFDFADKYDNCLFKFCVYGFE